MEQPGGRDLQVAHRLADIADRITTRAFRQGQALPHDVKDDGSPVTIYDFDVERAIATELVRTWPMDAVLGEEIGARGRASRRWVIDGIEGTIRFVHGDPRWSTMIALMEGDWPVVGISTGPAQGLRWWASCDSAAHAAPFSPQGLGRARRVRVSANADWATATVTSIPARDRLSDEEAATLRRVLGRGRYVPPSTHGAKMVASGRVDACLQLRGALWDYAALALIVEQAGGRVTSMREPHRLDHGGPMLYANGRLPLAA